MIRQKSLKQLLMKLWRVKMKSFEIHKASLDNKFTGINTKVLG